MNRAIGERRRDEEKKVLSEEGGEGGVDRGRVASGSQFWRSNSRG